MEEPRNKASNEKFCSECGIPIRAKAEICPHCGVRQTNHAAMNLGYVAPNGRSRIVAALLALFLGGFGVHKFYLGQIGMGLLYLLFFWTGIPAVIGLIEFVYYLVISDEKFAHKYGYS